MSMARFTTHINELPREEGRAILEFLCEFSTREEFQSVGSAGSLIRSPFGYNRCLQHQALWDYYPQNAIRPSSDDQRRSA